MRNAQPRRQKLPQGQIHHFFWAVQPAVRQAFAANRHPKATSMASYGRPSRPFAPKPLKPLKPLKPQQPLKPLKPFKLCKSVSECPTAQAKATPKPHTLFPSQRRPSPPGFRKPTGTPRPHQWLLLGVQACRLPAPKPLKPLKLLKPLKPLKLCKSVSECPTAQAKATPKPHTLFPSQRPSLFARRSQPTGTPRPHQWLLMGVQACRLPAPKPLKPLNP